MGRKKRRGLADVRGRAVSALADAYLRSGDAPEAAKWAEQSIALEPFRETGYRLLMEAHVAAGNRGEALRVYEQCRTLLADELGSLPLPGDRVDLPRAAGRELPKLQPRQQPSRQYVTRHHSQISTARRYPGFARHSGSAKESRGGCLGRRSDRGGGRRHTGHTGRRDTRDCGSGKRCRTDRYTQWTRERPGPGRQRTDERRSRRRLGVGDERARRHSVAHRSPYGQRAPAHRCRG